MPASLTKLWARLGIPKDYARVRHLPRHRETRTLVSIGRNPDGRTLKLAPRAAAAWRKMQAAAATDGVALLAISGFRSVARQAGIIRGKLAQGQAIGAILRVVAAPGCSEHHSGRAVDIGSPGDTDLDERFARTAAFRWLKRHASRHGFFLSYPRHNPHAISYEPWHWCWRRPSSEESPGPTI